MFSHLSFFSSVLAFSLASLLVSHNPFVRGYSASRHGVRQDIHHPHVLKRDTSHVGKRASGTITWYETGQGACGGFNSAGDWIVALNVQEWNGGSHCGEIVTITYNGKTGQGVIVDECMGCVAGELDLSRGFFQHFADPDIDGTFQGQWSFGGGSPEPTTTSTPPPPPPTTSSTLTSTSTSTTSTWSEPATTSSWSSTWSSSSSWSSETTSSSSSSSATPSSTSSQPAQPTSLPIDDNHVFNQLDVAFLRMGSLLAAALGAEN